ncbi:MAG: TolC family protein [Verrucomicrobia bacterium]|nr:TolC family protein [Verrucomicrobiota bacterium]
MKVQSSKRKVQNWLAACALTASVAFAQTNAPQPIDLATALRLAGARNLDVQIARERLSEAKANHQLAAQQFFPWLTPGVGYRRHDGLIQDVVGKEFNTSKQAYAAGGTIAAQIELGESYYRTLAARQLVQAADAGLEARQLESVHAAAQAYFDLLKAQASAGVAGESLEISKDFADQVSRAVEAGLAQKADALRASVQASRNQLALAQAHEQRRVAGARLAQALRLDAAVELTASDAELAPLTLVRTNASLDSLMAIALHSRPELKQGEAFALAAKKAREGAVKGPLAPTIGSQVFARRSRRRRKRSSSRASASSSPSARCWKSSRPSRS